MTELHTLAWIAFALALFVVGVVVGRAVHD